MPVRPGGSVPRRGGQFTDRRAERREPIVGNLWMIDTCGCAVLRCLCVDASSEGMRLRVPLGYGVQAGQRYELTSHLPGQSSPPGFGLTVSRRAEVVRTKIVSAADEYDVDVGVHLAPTRTAKVNGGEPITAMI